MDGGRRDCRATVQTTGGMYTRPNGKNLLPGLEAAGRLACASTRV